MRDAQVQALQGDIKNTTGISRSAILLDEDKLLGNTSISITTLRSNALCIEASEARVHKYSFTISPIDFKLTDKERKALIKYYLDRVRPTARCDRIVFGPKDDLFSPSPIECLERSVVQVSLVRSGAPRDKNSFKSFLKKEDTKTSVKIWTTLLNPGFLNSTPKLPFYCLDEDETELEIVDCTVSASLQDYDVLESVKGFLGSASKQPQRSVTEDFVDLLNRIMQRKFVIAQERAVTEHRACPVVVLGNKFFEFVSSPPWTGYGVELRRGIAAESRIVNNKVIRIMTPCIQLFVKEMSITAYLDSIADKLDIKGEEQQEKLDIREEQEKLDIKGEEQEKRIRGLKFRKANEAGPPLVVTGLSTGPPSATHFIAGTEGKISVQDYFERVKKIQLSDSCRQQRCINFGSKERPQYLPTGLCTILPGQPFSGALPSKSSKEVAQILASYRQAYPDPLDPGLRTLLSYSMSLSTLRGFNFTVKTGDSPMKPSVMTSNVLDCNELRWPKSQMEPKPQMDDQKEPQAFPSSVIFVVFGIDAKQSDRPSSPTVNGDHLDPTPLNRSKEKQPAPDNDNLNAHTESRDGGEGKNANKPEVLSLPKDRVRHVVDQLFGSRCTVEKVLIDSENEDFVENLGQNLSPRSDNPDCEAESSSRSIPFVLGLWFSGEKNPKKSAQLKRYCDEKGYFTKSFAVDITRSPQIPSDPMTSLDEVAVSADDKRLFELKLNTLAGKIQAMVSGKSVIKPEETEKTLSESSGESNRIFVGVHVTQVSSPGQTTRLDTGANLQGYTANSMSRITMKKEKTQHMWERGWFLITIVSKPHRQTELYRATTHTQQGFTSGTRLSECLCLHFKGYELNDEHLLLYRSGFRGFPKGKLQSALDQEEPFHTEHTSTEVFRNHNPGIKLSYLSVSENKSDRIVPPNSPYPSTNAPDDHHGECGDGESSSSSSLKPSSQCRSTQRMNSSKSDEVITRIAKSDMFHTGNGQFLLEKELHDNSSKSGVKLTPHAYYAKGEIGIPLKEQYEAAYVAAYDFRRGIYNTKVLAPTHFARLAMKRALGKEYARPQYNTEDDRRIGVPNDIDLPVIHQRLKNTLYYI